LERGVAKQNFIHEKLKELEVDAYNNIPKEITVFGQYFNCTVLASFI
jgi:hypothetical protein